jgi:O-antigen/teichoic acid export membrane protein
MRKKLFFDISLSTIQVIINQILGSAVFLITSIYLAKTEYGEFNWSLAFLTFATTILSLRLEQIVVQKIASGEDASKILSSFVIHLAISGIGFYVLLLLCSYIFSSFFGLHNLLLIIGISQLTSFFSSPFKQIANGKEKFGQFALMSLAGNFFKTTGLIFLIFFSNLTIHAVLIIFICSSTAELMLCFFLVRYKMKIRFTASANFTDYKTFLKQSTPQIGTAFLMAAISRLDWILLGFFSTQVKTAEYSFAYRAYELSPFPLLIIAPVLLTRFSRLFAKQNEYSLLQRKNELSFLLRFEMVLATFIPLILNIAWSPIMDTLTHGKYGTSNQLIFLILSFCIPFQYINNFFWTTHFAQGRLKLIFRIILVTCLIILIGDFTFIPIYNVQGAACVYLAATIVEYLNYMRSSVFSAIKETWQSLFICMSVAVISGVTIIYFFDSVLLRLLFSSISFFTLLVISGQLKKSDLQYLTSIPVAQKASSHSAKAISPRYESENSIIT